MLLLLSSFCLEPPTCIMSLALQPQPTYEPMNHRSSIPLSWLPPLALAVVHAATNSCVGRLGYDLEGKCKDIVARRSARGGGGGGGAKAGRSSPNAKGSAARRDAGNSSRSAAPNYTSESVIEDIYGGVAAQQAGTGSRDRATRASRRSASSVSWRFLARVRRRGGGGAEAEVYVACVRRRTIEALARLHALEERKPTTRKMNVPQKIT